jgi:ABC-type hemin transport system ATPase subunit
VPNVDHVVFSSIKSNATKSPVLAGIIGPSGSGKTRAINALAEEVGEGSMIRVSGEEADRAVKFLPAKSSVRSHLWSELEKVHTNGGAEVDALLNHIRNACLLDDDCVDRPFRELASSERQRAEMALTLAQGIVRGRSGTNCVVVFDEFTSNMDLRSSLNDSRAKHRPMNNRLKSIRLQQLKIHISRFS